MENNASVPVLFPIEPEVFWQKMRLIIREEIAKLPKETKDLSATFQTTGLTYKPLYKMEEICSIFTITRPTIYEWIKHGKLKPYKIRSRVYFLYDDLQELLKGRATDLKTDQ